MSRNNYDRGNRYSGKAGAKWRKKFKVESGIPIPPQIWNKKKTARFPLERMNLGDSFFMKISAKKRARTQASLMGAIKTQIVKRIIDLDFRITTRYIDNGLRIWRIQ